MGQGVALVSYLDTQVVVWLYAKKEDEISSKARQQIEKSYLLISAMVMLELEMLFEKGVLAYDAEHVYSHLHHAIGIQVCALPMAQIIRSALAIKWTREPGDRLITANAMANNQAPLVTKDRQIRKHYLQAIW